MLRVLCPLVILLSIFFIAGCSGRPGSGNSSSSSSSGSSSSDNTAFTSFLSVNGTGFSGGFKFSGANIDPWRFMTAAGEVYSEDDIRGWVNNAVNYNKAKVVRMHINGGAFEPVIGTYNEAAFKQLDYLIAACVENKIYCLIALRDYIWSPWPPSSYDPYWFIGAGPGVTNKDAILTNPAAIADYKNFISYVLNRTNTVTGTVYKNDKNIMAWELINEPNIILGVTGPWLADIKNYIKGIDPNHLITFGIAGAENSFWAPGQQDWSEISAANLDFIELHYYAAESFYNPVDPSNVSNLTIRVTNILALNKPAVIGEFGCVTTNSLTTMSNLYQTVISASVSAGASGCLPFAWGPPGPNGYGGTGSFDIYTNYQELCSLLKSLAP